MKYVRFFFFFSVSSLVHDRRRLPVEKRESLQNLSAPPLHHAPTQKLHLGRQGGARTGTVRQNYQSMNQ